MLAEMLAPVVAAVAVLIGRLVEVLAVGAVAPWHAAVPSPASTTKTASDGDRLAFGSGTRLVAVGIMSRPSGWQSPCQRPRHSPDRSAAGRRA